MKTVIIGLGNPLLGDDGVGWQVADRVKEQLSKNWFSQESVDVENLSLGGLSLMERLVGYDRAILIDAMNLGQGPIGELYTFDLADIINLSTGHTTAAHDTSLQTALEIGRSLGMDLPAEITILGIEAKIDYTITDTLTPEVDRIIPRAAQIALDILESKNISIKTGIRLEDLP